MTPPRILPHSLDAERAVLGAMLLSPAALDEVGSILGPGQFYRQSHQRIYAALVSLAERGIPADDVVLKTELQRRGELDACGGPAYVADLTTGLPRRTHVAAYAAIVRSKALLRDVIEASATMATAAYAPDGDAAAVLAEAERTLLQVSEQATTGDLQLLEALLPAAMAQLEAIAGTGQACAGLSTGFPTLDGYTRGLHLGNLLVLGGRPAEGKSALALQVALHVAQTAPVAFFSMEMNRDEIVTRALAQLARVDHHQMMQGRLSDRDLQRVGAARLALERRPLAIDDQCALTPFQIRSKARTMQARHGLGMIVVDYLQLLQRPRTAHSREEAVAENTWALKMLAGELRVPVLLLSQLNRAPMQRADQRPTLSDLRESGAVEQHANVVLLIYKPPPQSDGVVVETPPVELLIAKQRNGPAHVKVDLHFRGPSMRFDETGS